jgi:DNA-directed RNA polymerase-5 subunit 1
MLSHLVHPFLLICEYQKYVCIFRHQKQINLDETSEAAPTLVGHIHLDKVYDVFWLLSLKLLLKNMCISFFQAQLERINISTQDILQQCEEISAKYGKKKGHLCHLFKKITFTTW